MALRITPMRPIERNGLKGFGMTVFIDNSPETANEMDRDVLRGDKFAHAVPAENARKAGPKRADGSVSHAEAGESPATISHSSALSSRRDDKTGEDADSPSSPVPPSSGA